MEVHFKPELQAKVDRVAAENRSGADDYVQQLVENYLDDAWFRKKVTGSLGGLTLVSLLRRASSSQSYLLAADERGLTRIGEAGLESVFIGVHRRPILISAYRW